MKILRNDLIKHNFTESLSKDIELEYFDLHVSDGENSHTFSSFTFTPDEDEVINALCDLTGKDDVEVEEDLDNLVDKHYDDLLDYFKEKASAAALDNYLEDKEAYDDHSGDEADAWYDTRWERESLKEDNNMNENNYITTYTDTYDDSVEYFIGDKAKEGEELGVIFDFEEYSRNSDLLEFDEVGKVSGWSYDNENTIEDSIPVITGLATKDYIKVIYKDWKSGDLITKEEYLKRTNIPEDVFNNLFNKAQDEAIEKFIDTLDPSAFNESFKDYNPDDVPEDDTEDYEDHILRTNEDYYYDDTEDEEEYDPVNPPVNLYDYLKENSNGAWISFSFDLGDGYDWQENYCHGIEDFRDPERLKQYEVIGESASGFSQSQGTHYDLEVRKIGSNKKTTEHEDWTKELFDSIADGLAYSLKRNDIPAFIEKGKEFGYEWLYINNRLYLKGRDDYSLVSDAVNGILNDLRLMTNDINYRSYYRWNNKTNMNDIVEITNWGKWEDNKLSRDDQDILDKLIATQNNKFGVNITAEYPGNNKIILHLNNK